MSFLLISYVENTSSLPAVKFGGFQGRESRTTVQGGGNVGMSEGPTPSPVTRFLFKMITIMKQRIKITSNGVADLWRLPCVQGLGKKSDGKMLVGVGTTHVERLADEGDWLVENEDGTWSVEKGGGE